MSIQDLGSIGELVAAIATVATLIYLAIQLRQNTKAMRSSTFQQISSQMGQNIESVATSADLAEILAKVLAGDSNLTPAERLRFQGVLVMSLRRLEAVFVQTELGSIDREMGEGFERSLLPMLRISEGEKWWGTAQGTFHQAFVDRVNAQLATESIAEDLPSIRLEEDQRNGQEE